VSAPSQAGDLAASIDGVDASSGGGVPEMDVTIVATTSSCQEVVLPWAPSKSLDGCIVVGLLELRSLQAAGIPNGDEIVVTTGS
jgi:hypothetical protein